MRTCMQIVAYIGWFTALFAYHMGEVADATYFLAHSLLLFYLSDREKA
jgi:hypothetical protein